VRKMPAMKEKNIVAAYDCVAKKPPLGGAAKAKGVPEEEEEALFICVIFLLKKIKIFKIN